MKLATTTEDFSHIFGCDHLNMVRQVAKAGFRYIDLSLYCLDEDDPFMSENWLQYVDEMKSLANDLGVCYVQSHLPGCNMLDEGLFEDYCKRTIRAIEVCGRLSIENAVIHTGWKSGITKEEYFRLNQEALKPLFPVMEKNNVNVLIENSTKANMGDMYYFFNGKDMKEFIEYVNHPLLHACWDTGHANIEGAQYDDIVILGDELRAVHINDNLGNSDRHMIPFMGTLNMDEVINALKKIDYKGYFTFEGHSVVPGNYWLGNRRMFDKEQRLFNPNLDVYDVAEQFLYSIGKICLSAYELYEE